MQKYRLRSFSIYQACRNPGIKVRKHHGKEDTAMSLPKPTVYTIEDIYALPHIDESGRKEPYVLLHLSSQIPR